MKKKLYNMISGIVLVIVSMLAIALVGLRLIGYTPYSVLSDSMSPLYKKGDLIYVQKVDPEQISIGDVITYVANEDLELVTHRVYDVDRKNGLFTTKGDANRKPDGKQVMYRNVLGTVAFGIPYIGTLSTYISSETGMKVVVVFLIILLLTSIIPDMFRLIRRRTRERTCVALPMPTNTDVTRKDTDNEC